MRAPLYEALVKYAEEKNTLLHMPGHKGGRGFTAPELRSIGVIDHTEVPGLDDLHVAEGVIMEAQRLAAEAWGAAQSLFLVNGATSGIHSLLLAIGEGARVLVPRNAHRSVIGGLILSGAEPIYMQCDIDPVLQIAADLDPREVKTRLDAHKSVKGAFLVSPTYYGTVSRVSEIAAVLKKARVPLLVDEAHGGHFAFHPGYPRPALSQGAMASVHGLHKTLPVLTQGGMLHLAADYPWMKQVQAAHDLLTTTSPSYPLMASLDLGRAIMAERGQELLERALLMTDRCCQAINKISGLRCHHASASTSGAADHDPLKILVEISGLDTTGIEIAHLLRARYGIQVEMAASNYLLAMFSPFNHDKDWDELAKALASLARSFGHVSRTCQSDAELPPIPPLQMTPRQAFLSRRKTVMIKESEGLISAESAAAYPPGIPCVMPGEVITHEIIEYIARITAQGISLHGLRDPLRQKIDVIE